MNTYWVNYDLNQSGQHYSELIEFLEAEDHGWAKPLKSSYFIESSMTASELLDAVMRRVDSNDQVVVVEVSGQSWAGYGMPSDVGAWMERNI